jgi:DNA-binding CsgD family transcriptional regulator
VQAEIWRGNFAEAARLSEEMLERALHLRSEVAVGGAMTMRAALAAYAGDEKRAREDVGAALEAIERCGARMVAVWPITIEGFLEVSLGNYKAALTTLEPLLSRLHAAPHGTEIYLAEFVPDAVEAMIQLGRFDEADHLIGILERNGKQVDRPWMLAVAGRCRAMLLAARGDVDAAMCAAEAAMSEHVRLPMPFERARTLLVLGQLQRRRRHKEAAAAALRAALNMFEALNTPLWANRARAELARTNVAPTKSNELTPSEQRVAELAASGMNYRHIAAALCISPKTVEANLTRIYRKLDIHSRAELGRLMAAGGRPAARR